MSSRETILKKIDAVCIDSCPLPTMNFSVESIDNQERFIRSLKENGANVIPVHDETSIYEIIQASFPTVKIMASGLSNNIVQFDLSDISTIEKVELAVLEGAFGVAENGAVWLEEKNMLHRALPFLTQDLVLIVRSSTIVDTMHKAYDLINSDCDYGVFISGPSKTADIEQSLVIGAHGARSLLVLLLQ